MEFRLNRINDIVNYSLAECEGKTKSELIFILF